MKTHDENLILFPEIFKMAARHFYSDASLVRFIRDLEGEIDDTDEIQFQNERVKIELTILFEKVKRINQKLDSGSNSETEAELAVEREQMQLRIQSLIRKLKSPAQLKEKVEEIQKMERAQKIMRFIRDAVIEKEIAFQTSDGSLIPGQDLFIEKSGIFVTSESVCEVEIDGQIRRDFVKGDRKQVRDWLVSKDIERGVFDTPCKAPSSCTNF